MNSLRRSVHQSRAIWTGLLLTAVLLSIAANGWSQKPAEEASGAGTAMKDLTGVWDIPGSGKDPISSGVGAAKDAFEKAEEPSMTAWGQERFQQNRKGVPPKARRANLKEDPGTYCLPSGPSRAIAST